MCTFNCARVVHWLHDNMRHLLTVSLDSYFNNYRVQTSTTLSPAGGAVSWCLMFVARPVWCVRACNGVVRACSCVCNVVVCGGWRHSTRIRGSTEFPAAPCVGIQIVLWRTRLQMLVVLGTRRHLPAVHAGFHVSGWKSLIDKQSRSLGLNRPLGVIIMTLGGANG